MKQASLGISVVAEVTVSLLAALLAVSQGAAQQITGTPGSPNATTTINGQQLPPPDPKFGGDIKENALQSKAWWPPRVVPPKGAPNILLIMTDDVGFGAPSTFGGVIPTPALDRIAQAGLRYTQFHSTVPLLTDTGSTHHRSQSSRRWFWRRFRSSDGFPRLRQHHPKGCGDHRGNSQGEWLRNRRGSVRTTTRPLSLPAKPGPLTNGRPAWASNTSTDLSVATPASGSRTYSVTPLRFILISTIPKWNLTTAMADDAIELDEPNQLNRP